MFSPENHHEQQGAHEHDRAVDDRTPLSPEELQELEKRYAVGRPHAATIGVLAVSAALSGGIPNEAQAQNVSKPERLERLESTERAVVRSGVAQHPERGLLTIQVYRKTVDTNNPTFNGNMYGVLINGAEMEVTASRFARNGAALVEFKSPTGAIEKLQYPSLQSAGQGEKPQYIINNGAQSLVIENGR